jgi:predicted RND superfamily exporter protein
VTQVLNKNIGHIAVAIIRFKVYILIVLAVVTLLFAGGFIIMLFSGYRPLVFFGVFVTANILLALVFDLIVLPAILMFRK